MLKLRGVDQKDPQEQLRRMGWGIHGSGLCLPLCGLCFAGCHGELLLGLDAGTGVDAGPARFDAGFPTDAGDRDDRVGEDAGFPDGGPRCVPEPNPVIPWDCEPDVDWCDLEGDWPLNLPPQPSADLRATWSHVDGDDLVFELRFAAMPFRDDVGQALVLFFENAAVTLDGPTAIAEDGDNESTVLSPGTTFGVQQLGGFRLIPFEFPPSLVAGNRNLPLDLCRFELSLTDPVAVIRLPLALVQRPDEPLRYAVQSTSSAEGNTHEVSWVGVPATVTTQGGRADVADNPRSFCDLGCDDGGKLEP